MYNKFDGFLAVVAVAILFYLSGLYSGDRYEAVHSGEDMSSYEAPEKDPILDDEQKNDIKLKMQARIDDFKTPNENSNSGVIKKKTPEQIEREKRLEESKSEERLAEEEKQKQELEAEKIAEEERSIETTERNQRLSDQMIYDLKQEVAGDPYVSERYIDAKILSEENKVVVQVDEGTFASLSLDAKKTVYEYASIEIKGFYLDYLQEYPELANPKEVIVELEDSKGQNLSTYRHDIIGDRYVIQLNHNNDSNF